VPANQRLDIQFVSCFVEMSTNSGSVGLGFLGVDDAWGSTKSRHSIDFRLHTFGDPGRNVYVAAHPMVLTILAGHRWAVAITANSGVNAIECAVSGELRAAP
jgi:hypothetical protein